MPGHLRRRRVASHRKQRSSTTPICPAGDGTARLLCHSSSPIAKHGVRRRFANSTCRVRHKHSSIMCQGARMSCRLRLCLGLACFHRPESSGLALIVALDLADNVLI